MAVLAGVLGGQAVYQLNPATAGYHDAQFAEGWEEKYELPE